MKRRDIIALAILILLAAAVFAYLGYVTKKSPSIIGGGYDAMMQKDMHYSFGEPVPGNPSYVLRTKITPFGTTTLPYLLTYSDSQSLKSVNVAIKSLEDDLSCASLVDLGEEPAPDWDAYAETTVIYAKGEVFSFAYGYDLSCGGPHPNHDTSAITFDLKTGKEIPWQSLFKDYEGDRKAIYAILFKAYSGQEDYQSECIAKADVNSGESIDAFDEPAYTLSDKGFSVLPSFPYALGPCTTELDIPFKQLSTYLAPDTAVAKLISSQ